MSAYEVTSDKSRFDIDAVDPEPARVRHQRLIGARAPIP
jgi:hypothetical protein